jgi:hypothetical protein
MAQTRGSGNIKRTWQLYLGGMEPTSRNSDKNDRPAPRRIGTVFSGKWSTGLDSHSEPSF